MSDTPRTDAAEFDFDEDCVPENNMVVASCIMAELERELNEANADRLRLRKALQWASIEAKGRLPDWFHEVLTTPPPPVVDKKDADALAEAVKIMRVGICSAAIPNATEREIASDAVKQASEVLKTYLAKYKC
jgi:hypothetical protein